MEEKQKALMAKIDFSEKLHNEHGYLMMPNPQEWGLTQPKAAELTKELAEIMYQDIQLTALISKTSYLQLLLSPFEAIVKFFHTILSPRPPFIGEMRNYVETPSLPKRRSLSETDKILSNLEIILKENADTTTFVDELRVYMNKVLQTTSLMQLSENAQVDYSYLNKLHNKKLPVNTVISRDLIIKLGLAMKLNLIDTNKLLAKAGYILCGQNIRDIILGLCLEHEAGVTETNLLLDQRGLRLLKGTSKGE